MGYVCSGRMQKTPHIHVQSQYLFLSFIVKYGYTCFRAGGTSLRMLRTRICGLGSHTDSDAFLNSIHVAGRLNAEATT